MFLCCNTRVSVVILEYFSGSISTLQPILAAGRASLLARPTSECHLLRAFFPERRRFRKWCRSFNRSQQHDDPVTELKQTQTRSRSEMGSAPKSVFGQEELGNVNRDDGMIRASYDDENDDKNIWTRAMLFGWTGLTVDR